MMCNCENENVDMTNVFVIEEAMDKGYRLLVFI